MPTFGKVSTDRRDTCHPDIRTILDEVIKRYDIAIICGHRNEIAQMLDNIDTRMIAVHNLVNAGQRARSRDEDVQPFIDALRAL